MSTTSSSRPILRAVDIRKSFGGVPVLDLAGSSVELRPGEVHALLGENGAGKSTLLKIIGGIHRPDAGQIYIDDRPVSIDSPQAAQRLRIALIHQEPLVFPDLNVAENIYLGYGRGAPSPIPGVLNRRAMYDGARRLIERLGVNLNPRAKLRGLSVADQQTVELAGALSQNARVLLMDEPTASLTPAEVAEMFRIVRQLRNAGAAVVFISHRLEEVFAIADRITVLRDGRFVATKPVAETSTDDVIQMMVGRSLHALYEKEPAAVDVSGTPRLRVENLSGDGRFRDIGFEVHRGEIVGLAGLVGAGRTDVAQAIFGITRPRGGRIFIDGAPARIGSPRDAVDRGVAYVPEDRQHDGLLLPFSIARNATLASLGGVSRGGWISSSRERRVADDWRTRLGIRSYSADQTARELSGGNQQKVVLGKWLQTDPQVLILDEPTRGIDIGAKTEVHRLMSELARQGKAILMISSDLPEVLAMSDRVLVMREGRLTGEFTRAQATQEKVMVAATGQAPTIRSPGVPGEGEQTRGRALDLSAFRELGIFAFVALSVIVASVAQPRFLQRDNLANIMMYIPLIVTVAMGQMLVVITRNIDLSVGSILGLAAIVVGQRFVANYNFPIWEAAILACAVGAVAGLVNGLLVAQLRVPAIIATLGTLTAYRGLIFIYSHGRQVDPNDIPENLIRLSQTSPLFGIPWLVIFAAILAVITWLLLRYTRAGREVYAIGSNPPAAALRGVPVKSRLIGVFTITGALSGLAGLMYASRFGYVNPVRTGQGFELVVISAVVLGGVNVFGGSGTVLGVLLGCLMLGVVNVALPVMGISAFWQMALYGIAILIAATIDTVLQRGSRR